MRIRGRVGAPSEVGGTSPCHPRSADAHATNKNSSTSAKKGKVQALKPLLGPFDSGFYANLGKPLGLECHVRSNSILCHEKNTMNFFQKL